MKIYTKTGDNITTSLVTKRVDKDDIRIEIEGVNDEFMAQLTFACTFITDLELKKIITDIIEKQFIISSDALGYGKVKIEVDDVKYLEELIDKYTSKLPPIKGFISLGSKQSSTIIQVCRTICRRLERKIVTLAKIEKINPRVLEYINRLSDLLFTLGRYEEEVNA